MIPFNERSNLNNDILNFNNKPINKEEKIENFMNNNSNFPCKICKQKASIYKCPRCQIKTCCLACVKEHKQIYKCNGIRDKFSKKFLKDFTENDYIRDMNFLNSTMNETTRIEKKMFNLTEENHTDKILIENKSKINSAFNALSNINDTNTYRDEKENDLIKNKNELIKNFVRDCKITFVFILHIKIGKSNIKNH